jgi:hypothetical protein
VGLCTVIITEYGDEREEGLARATAALVLKQDPMELPDALKDLDAVPRDEAPALSALFTQLTIPAGSAQAGQILNHHCRSVFLLLCLKSQQVRCLGPNL